ncbi:hypothetical protein [Paraburkholderia dioscoreae]|uniref:Uncharacterized protein n=1 Tax=Paraburkholderia dioscoreae TaxID=2604047 RepID=A0A5Q4Z988_9BURK|nr:hypothetical protein [Paraburkholderia dioscoreae]VVD30909.1 conserved protein of unknown function [Paraburkholderia dioscoreae]
MKHEYCVQTDILETVVASAPVELRHAALLAALATRTEFRSPAYVTSRDSYGAHPARVFDAAGALVADNYRDWIRSEIDARNGDVAAVWEHYKDEGYLLSEIQPVLHFFVHDRGGAQDNFTQFRIFTETEAISRNLFTSAAWRQPERPNDLLVYHNYLGEPIDPRPLGSARYRLYDAIDMPSFLRLADACTAEERRVAAARRFKFTDLQTGESGSESYGEMYPAFDKYPHKSRRFFDDWCESSAGASGERICRRWVFEPQDSEGHQSDQTQPRHLYFIPQWGHNRKVAAVEKTRNMDDYALFGRLNKFDERIGVPFSWYFYGLHGDLVKSGSIERILAAAENGLIVLPEHDYRVLKRWQDQPYGF